MVFETEEGSVPGDPSADIVLVAWLGCPLSRRQQCSGPYKGSCNDRSVCRITLGRVDVHTVLETEEGSVPADQSADIVPVAWLPMCGQYVYFYAFDMHRLSESVEALLQERFD